MKTLLIWFGGFIILFAVIIAYALQHSGNPAGLPPSASAATSATVALDGTEVHVDLATTPAAQEKGLGGRTSLAPGSGMLFIFPQDGRYAFWMKDMSFPIDIIWMDDTGKVIYVVPDLSPQTYPHSYGPIALSRFVLEVPAGFAASHRVQVGDRAQLP
jgi:uncharacterized membrane protein (UPF0127 family)